MEYLYIYGGVKWINLRARPMFLKIQPEERAWLHLIVAYEQRGLIGITRVWKSKSSLWVQLLNEVGHMMELYQPRK